MAEVWRGTDISLSRDVAVKLLKPSLAADPVVAERFRREAVAVAGLTAVDGATLISSTCDVLAFGAKIARRRGQPLVEQIVLTEPIEDTVPVVLAPAALGGTRHLSAAQFVHDQRDALALVASQDGHVTVFAWSTDESMVHAHRIETLLM